MVNEFGTWVSTARNWKSWGGERNPNINVVFRKSSGSSTDLYFAGAKVSYRWKTAKGYLGGTFHIVVTEAKDERLLRCSL